MEYTNLEKNLIRSFSNVKKDVIRLKDKQEIADEKLDEKFDELYKKLSEKINSAIMNKSTEKDYSSEISRLKKEIEELKNNSSKKSEINTKLLPMYSDMKQNAKSREELRDVEKKVKILTLKMMDLSDSNTHLIESKIDVEKLKTIFTNQTLFEKEIKEIKEKLKHVHHTHTKLTIANEKILEIIEKSKKFVATTEYESAFSIIQKDIEMLNEELERIETIKLEKEDIQKTEKQIIIFQSDMSTIRHEIDLMNKEFDRIEAEKPEDKEVKKIQVKISEFQNDINTIRQEIILVSKTLDRLDSNNIDAKEIKKTQAKVVEYEKELSTIRHEIGLINKEFDRIETEKPEEKVVKKIQAKILGYDEELTTIRHELGLMNKEFDRIETTKVEEADLKKTEDKIKEIMALQKHLYTVTERVEYLEKGAVKPKNIFSRNKNTVITKTIKADVKKTSKNAKPKKTNTVSLKTKKEDETKFKKAINSVIDYFQGRELSKKPSEKSKAKKVNPGKKAKLKITKSSNPNQVVETKKVTTVTVKKSVNPSKKGSRKQKVYKKLEVESNDNEYVWENV